jgi:hypothetical protein
MSSLAIKFDARATVVSFNEVSMCIKLVDGREIIVPLEWFPRLRDATVAQRNNYRLIGDGIGIHWDDLDEDLSVVGLLHV